ncbi:AAA family ATPase, partial [Rhizobium nepotum]
AGMIGSRQLCRFVREVEARGAKLVLVGDHEQLQAIGAGSPFRAITERTGAIELTDIRRQNEAWQQLASTAFATRRTSDALVQYARYNAIRFADNRAQACGHLVRDYLQDRRDNPDQSRIALAHRRIDVRAINDAIREGLQAEGVLAKAGAPLQADAKAIATDNLKETNDEIIYQTIDGKRAFAAGDRIVLLQNNRDLDVKNGMLGTVEAVEPDALHLRLDGGSGGQETGRRLTVRPADYQSFDHGYATTIHKAQGTTVDRAFVMASASMDRHLTYVAMTRHRHQATLYAGRDELGDMKDLTDSLSRSGLKETTLDYIRAFAERRGLKEPRDDGIRQTSLQQIMEGQRQGMRADRMAKSDLRHQSPQYQPPGHQPPEVLPPLVPAITRYDRSIDEVAREAARPDLEESMERVFNIALRVYHDVFSALAAIQTYVIDPAILARAISQRPDQFGTLRGNSGIFGDNKERKEALRSAHALASQVQSARERQKRQIEAARSSETWQREKRDVVEVPALTRRSEEILTYLDALSHQQKPEFLDHMRNSAEGRKALAEAQDIVNALQQRFGTADRLQLARMDLRIGADVADRVEQIVRVAHLVGKVQSDELTRQHELKQSVTRTLGLRL